MAQLAGRASVALHTVLYFQSRKITEPACVMRVRKNGAIVLVPRFGIEGPVYVAAKEDTATLSQYRFEEEKKALVHLTDDSKSLRVFDEVKVLIEVIEVAMFRKELQLSLVWPGDKESDADPT